MRKREQQQPHFYLDIFEPPPQWRTAAAHSNNAGGNAGYHAHSPTHRSPIHHQPSLSEIVYQDYNSNAEIQDVYPIYQERRHQQRHSYIRGGENLGVSESSSTIPHTISTDNNIEYEIHEYDDIDDEESVDKNLFQRHQSDNVSISNSLFTAVDHLEIVDNNSNNDEHQEQQQQQQQEHDDDDDDDNSSTENLRHGYLPVHQTPYNENESINSLTKKLNVQTAIAWEDYRPQYRLLNESYDNVKKEIYKEIYSTMERMQEMDLKFNAAKVEFQLEMEKGYIKMSDELFLQCQDLCKEKEYVNQSKVGQDTEMSFQNEKVRLNVGGNIFETSLSTLRRDTNSLLATMFSGRHPILAESDGSYFIDRDPSHFRLVLNYLRDLRIPPTILQDVKIRQELLQEAKYYCINGLITILHTFAQDHYNNKVITDKSNGFTVEYFDTYKVLTNILTDERYALVCCNNSLANFTTGYHGAVNTPLNNVAVENELDALTFFELLGKADTVKAISPSANVTSPCYAGITDGPNSTTTPIEAIFTSRSNGAVVNTTQYIGVSTGDISLTPLQQASWIIFIAHFFEMETFGQQVYNGIESKYNCHKSHLAKSGKKNIAWTTYDSVAKLWTIHSDQYTNTLIHDAGMKLVPASNQTTTYSNLKDFQGALSTADYVIDDSPAANFKTDFDYADWLNVTGLPPSSKDNFIANKNVYRTDNLINKNGFSDWSIRHPARADLAIADIIHMVYNTYEPTYNMTWLRGFALMRQPNFISNDTYPSCTNTVARIDINTCSINPFTPNSPIDTSPSTYPGINKSGGLTTGGKIGVAVGVVVVFVIAAVAGTFIYRKRKHRANNEGTFVKMNDM